MKPDQIQMDITDTEYMQFLSRICSQIHIASDIDIHVIHVSKKSNYKYSVRIRCNIKCSDILYASIQVGF
jgi:hypothetical protein